MNNKMQSNEWAHHSSIHQQQQHGDIWFWHDFQIYTFGCWWYFKYQNGANLMMKKKMLRTFKWTASTHIRSKISLLQSKYGNSWRWHRNKMDERIFFIFLKPFTSDEAYNTCMFFLGTKECARDYIEIWTRFRVLLVIDLAWCILFLLIHFHQSASIE